MAALAISTSASSPNSREAWAWHASRSPLPIPPQPLPQPGPFHPPAGLPAGAARAPARLRDLPLFLLPCLNPWGLTHNVRLDAAGIDLNRSFHREDLPEIVALRELAHGYQFDLSLMLHEDYDGQGIYLYEVQRELPYWGEALLEAARPILPIEPRARIDGRKASGGLIRRRLDHHLFGRIGYPEA